MHNPLIVALDVPDAARAVRLAQQVGPWVGALKVGLELFTAEGPEIVRRLRDTNVAVFLDLKLHDIPHTVAKAVASATRLDVQMLTLHTSGGGEMMRAAEASAQETARSMGRPAPRLFGVTVLTSMDSSQLAAVSLETDVARHVTRLAQLAVTSGLRGLVCSPLELKALRAAFPAGLQLVTPGIRTGPPPPGDDQQRTLGPAEALAAGANWLVIGRPIYAAPDPVAATREILERIGFQAEGYQSLRN